MAEPGPSIRMTLGPTSRPAKHAAGPAVPTRAVARQDRAGYLRRARAAAQLIRAAFPGVDHLRIELGFEDRSSISPTAQVHLLYQPARAYFTYPCPHSDCDGEFDLEHAVRMAVSDGTRTARGSVLCGGARAGEPGSKRPCELQLIYTITAHRDVGT